MGNQDQGRPLFKREPWRCGFLFAMEGADAARSGLPARENPYPTGSEQSAAWLEGWIQNALNPPLDC
jgi:hypothetical protein